MLTYSIGYLVGYVIDRHCCCAFSPPTPNAKRNTLARSSRRRVRMAGLLLAAAARVPLPLPLARTLHQPEGR